MISGGQTFLGFLVSLHTWTTHRFFTGHGAISAGVPLLQDLPRPGHDARGVPYELLHLPKLLALDGQDLLLGLHLAGQTLKLLLLGADKALHGAADGLGLLCSLLHGKAFGIQL